MIDYKLAEELKEAGFSQGIIGGYGISINEIQRLGEKGESIRKYIKDNDIPYYPTLSELIEACEEKFHCLVYSKDNKFWSAGTTNIVKDWQNGKTPEEAVARWVFGYKLTDDNLKNTINGDFTSKYK